MNCILVTGPTRSGKSEWAERLAEHWAKQNRQPVIYVATAKADPSDPEWTARLEQHRQRRPPHWQTLESPHDLAELLRSAQPQTCWLVDSLGTWLANRLDEDELVWQQTRDELVAALAASPATVILVAEETGWGIVPAYELGRRFRDRLGELSRCVGRVAAQVYLVVAGYALNLTELGVSVDSKTDLKN
ncbi:bifunctional adenosylcobinamide kinase/adenosylcobinamide-phosphate guanylyltransferase [Leptolyngbya sp. FACHB-261]|uniref:bifunctional adenosylcobinamide kinase/adenosylcobinamide-phosphate guanylyltransferase n=1 Tax=Leptolyngbya sp. FACHB-261 TaxID=2692806 RepID=UPI001681D409|nr:bifunctional adenosylcobinamide kinase/adenosylcobinamide-phosphate guanylyltransferase [Leptolyngbya sp. FACHB-261]MBD2101452.1 bifunctional adenosylcobinamide kinase/adenosylcobinamide-phosphate guanylyltransferase [Leptolyngbya sp. FACHB-261]